jgi:hypothetical protein
MSVHEKVICPGCQSILDMPIKLFLTGKLPCRTQTD